MMATILSGYLQWFFRVSAVLVLGVSWGQRCRCADFTKLQATMFPALSSQCFCVGVFLGISYYLEAAVIQGIFKWLCLTFIYYCIYIIIHFCLVFVTRLGFFQLPHTYIAIVSGFVLLDLVDMLFSFNLPLNKVRTIVNYFTIVHTKYFFPTRFSLFV